MSSTECNEYYTWVSAISAASSVSFSTSSRLRSLHHSPSLSLQEAKQDLCTPLGIELPCRAREFLISSMPTCLFRVTQPPVPPKDQYYGHEETARL